MVRYTFAMDALRSHPYIASLVAAFVLVGAGGLVVVRTIVAPGDASGLGGLGAALLDPTSYKPSIFTPEPSIALGNGGVNAPPYIPPPTELTTIDPADEFDFNAFFAEISRGEVQAEKPPAGTGTGSVNAYSFIPTGLIATSSAVGAKRSPLQQSLFDWGNDAGSSIQSFEAQNRTITQVLKDHAEDRHDPLKIAALKKLGDSMQELGGSFSRMDAVPSAARGVNDKLAAAYSAAGGGLAMVANTATDKGFIEAVIAYNGNAEAVMRAFIAISALFSANGVKFDPGDAGSVFLFSNARL